MPDRESIKTSDKPAEAVLISAHAVQVRKQLL